MDVTAAGYDTETWHMPLQNENKWWMLLDTRWMESPYIGALHACTHVCMHVGM